MTQEKAEIKHTPGPWTASQSSYGRWMVDERSEHAAYKVKHGDDLFIEYTSRIAEIAGAGELLELAANARLIAAAPDLLAALDYLLAQTVDMDLKHGIELTEGETEARTLALAAIAKATNPKP